MSFLSPIFFVALSAILIPVIIHLIHFRKPRTVAFSTLAFFRELQKSTIRRLNLKRYLLLAMRILAVMLLATALARPFLPPLLSGWLGHEKGSQQIAILMDNGPSMMQVDASGPYMDQSRSIAREIILQSPDDSRFLVVPTHGELESARLMRQSEALHHLDQMEPLNRGAFPAERMRFMRERLADEPGRTSRLYWITDARKTQLQRLDRQSPASLEPDREIPVTVIRTGSGSFQNVGVVSVSPTGQIAGAGLPAGITVGVRNFGDEPVYNSFLSLEIDGDRIGQYEVDLEEGEQKEYLFEVIPSGPGIIRGKALLEGGTYRFDHERFFSLEIPDSRDILLITDRGEDQTRRSYLKPVLIAAAETGTRLRVTAADVSNLREHNFDAFDAVVLDGLRRIPDYVHAELVQYVQQGRAMILLPSELAQPSHYNSFLRSINAGVYEGMRGTYGRFEEIASLQALADGHILVDELFEDREEGTVRIDMPALYHYWMYSPPEGASGSTLLRSNLDDPLFVEHPFGDGMVLIGMMGLGPGWSNLAVKPVYAPLIYRLMLHVVAWEHGGVREHVLGNPFDRYLPDFGAVAVMNLHGREYRAEVSSHARGVRVRYPGREWEPGWLDLGLNGNKYTVAVNQDILESDFSSLDNKETEQFLEELIPLAGVLSFSGLSDAEIRTAVASVSFGREIWTLFIWLALAFLVAECIISRLYKTETTLR